MSGYNSRKIYDACYESEFINQQVKPAKYNTFSGYGENDVQCTSLNGPRANQQRNTGELGLTTREYRTDIESQLKNLDIPDSRCITINTMKEKNKRLKKYINKNIKYSNCNNKQNYNYTRLNNPVHELRSVEINRFEFPIIDPIEFTYYGTVGSDQIGNERFGINTQLRAKDDIRAPNMQPSSLLTK